MMLEAEAESNGEMRGASVGASEPTANDWSIGSYLLLFVGFALLSFAIYRPALHGEFVSDDMEVLVNNPFVSALTVENLVAIIDIRSTEKSFTGNYAPVDELLMALEDEFGVKIPDEEAESIMTVGQAVDLVYDKLGS